MSARRSENGGQKHSPAGARAHRPTLAALVVLITIVSATQAKAAERFTFREPHLGTVVDLTLYADSETVAIDSSRAAFERIRDLNRILSDYDPQSELMRLCAKSGTGEAVPVSAELFEVLESAMAHAAATDGAFDITIGPVVRLWRVARKTRQLPPAEQLEAARRLVNWREIRLDSQARTVELRQAGMLLDLGGLAKGYIADQARETLAARGIRQCLVAIGGDLSIGDPPPERDFWRIGIAPLETPDGPPSRYLKLSRCSVSTAGDAFQFVEIGGVRYSHIVDPRTGLGLQRRMSVTVISPHGILADGLDTAVCLVGMDKGLALIEKSPGAAGLIVVATDTGLEVKESQGLTRLIDR